MTRNMEMSTLLCLLILAVMCNSHGHAAYFYNRGTNTGAHSKPSGYHVSQHHATHHKNHHHGGSSSSGRIQQAAVGVISRGRLVPHTASAVTTTLSPLDRLMNRLDSEEKHTPQHHHGHNHLARFDHGRRHHDPAPSYAGRHHATVPPTFLKSSDHHRYAQATSNADDSYEDDDEDDEDDEDDDVVDDGENRDEEDEDDDEDEEEEEVNAGRHHHRSQSRHRGGGHTGSDISWFDGTVADFPDHTSYGSSGGSADSGSGSGSGSGASTRYGGYSSYSEYKWNTLNPRNMDIMRNQKPRPPEKTHASAAAIKNAVAHALKVNNDGLCRDPKPRLIRVKDIYPHPSKTYYPHCTILHLCGDDTGCCRSDTFTCIARHTEAVELYFYTTTMGRGGPTVEKLTFHNHTECACADRLDDVMPRDKPSSGGELDGLGKSGFRGYYRPESDGGRTTPSPEGPACRCTSQFSARHVDGACACECFDKQRDCIRSKRGKEFLPHSDRICVLRGDCTAPSCEFGSYLRRAGRCPRKSEKFETWQQYPQHDEEYK